MTTNPGVPYCIAVDWGTSRFRAYLVAADGSILERIATDDGMASVVGGDFAGRLHDLCGPWQAGHPGLPVLMAGMVGSRNGWREVPYVPCPGGPDALAGGILRIENAAGVEVMIVPGMTAIEDGVMDVLRGEETQIVGAGVDDGVVVLPGTHSKWAVVQGGRIVAFRTFMTGEVYGLLLNQSVLRLLADPAAGDQEDDRAFLEGIQASRRPGGLLHNAFMARTGVLSGALRPSEVPAFLSGLLIGSEVAAARAFGPTDMPLLIIAEGPIADGYARAVKAAGLESRVVAPEPCFVAGMLTLARARL